MKFDSMKNGYNRYQVDDLIAKLEEENALLKSKLDAYEKQFVIDRNNYEILQKKYDAMAQDIEIKEKAAHDIASIALKEANDIIMSANKNADDIVKEALFNARDILNNISKLGLEAREIKLHMNEQMNALSKAVEEFDVPPVPNPLLLNKCNE